MISRINKLLSLVCTAGIAVYIVVKNQTPVHVHLYNSYEYNISLGLVIVLCFITGVLLTAFFASLFSFKSYIRERALLTKAHQKEINESKIIEARSAQVAEQTENAISLWNQLIKRIPSNPIPRIELAKSLYEQNNYKEALEIIEAARIMYPDNSEILFISADINNKLGNKTIALDYLTTILNTKKSRKAAKNAMIIAEELGNYDKALYFNEQLKNAGEIDGNAKSRLEYKKILSEYSSPEILYKKLYEYTKGSQSAIEAVAHLAKLENDVARYDSAVQLYIRAAKISGDIKFWRNAIQILIERNQPEKALATAKTARSETKGDSKLNAQLMIIRLQLQLALIGDAYKSIEEFLELSKSQVIEPPREILSEFLTLRTLYFNLVGNFQESANTLKMIDRLFLDSKIGLNDLFSQHSIVREEHEAHLSTP